MCYIYQREISIDCMAHLFCIFLVRFLYNLQQSRSPRGNLLAIVTSLPSFIHYCKHDELWGCAEILLDLTSSKFRVDGDVNFFFGTRDSDLIKMSFAADKAWIVHFPEILSPVLLFYIICGSTEIVNRCSVGILA